MAIASQFDGRKVMKLTQAARFMSTALKMLTQSAIEHERKGEEKREAKLSDEVFKDKPDIKKIESLLGHSCVRFDDNGVHFDDHIQVRLLKNYAPAEFSIAMSEYDVGCIRTVNNNSGLTAILYSSYDEDKMSSALKSMETVLGASPVISEEELKKMCTARGKESKMFEFSNLSYADTRRFEFAASKNSMNISISQDNTSNRESYKVKVLSTDKEKIQKAIKDVAIYRVKDDADSIDRHYEQLEQAATVAAQKTVDNETFYVCSASRSNSYIEVSPKGYNVCSQDGDIVKVAKANAGKINDSRAFIELCEEMAAFENPVILSAEEFSENADERLSTVVANMTTLEQKNEGQAYVTDLTLKVLSVANELDYDIKSVNDIASQKLLNYIEKADIPNKESIVASIGHLKNLPDNMISEVLSEYKDNIRTFEVSLSEAEREYEISNERETNDREIGIENISEEKE